MTSQLMCRYLSKIKNKLIAVLAISFSLGLFACMQTENSSSGDAQAYGAAAAGSPELEAVRGVFKTSCATCHPGYPTMTDAQFVAQGLVTAADPDNSKIFSTAFSANNQ